MCKLQLPQTENVLFDKIMFWGIRAHYHFIITIFLIPMRQSVSSRQAVTKTGRQMHAAFSSMVPKGQAKQLIIIPLNNWSKTSPGSLRNHQW